MKRFGIVAIAVGLLAPVEAGRAQEALSSRGAYLVNTVMICGRCHTTPGPAGKPFAGGRMIETPAYKVQGSNITPDPETGIGSWSDEQIGRAIIDGVRPDGSRMSSAMPYDFYAVLDAGDRASIIAYLRALAPVKNATAAPIYVVPPATAPRVPALDTPDPSSSEAGTLRHGWYLATLARCLSCHSTPTVNGEPDLVAGLGRGGARFEGPWGVVVAPDITRAGLSGWSDEEIARALVEGVAPDGRKLAAPMQAKAYAQMSRNDLAALIAWVRTLQETK